MEIHLICGNVSISFSLHTFRGLDACRHGVQNQPESQVEQFVYCILFLLAAILSIPEGKSMASAAVISIAKVPRQTEAPHLAQVVWKAAANIHLLAKMSVAMA